MRKLILASSLFLLLAGCSTSTENTGYGDDGIDPVEDATGVYKVRTTNTLPTESGEFAVGNEVDGDVAKVDGDTLLVNVGYGGCANVPFELSWDGTFKDSSASLVLSREMPGEVNCMMYITDQVKFDLTPVKKAYEEEFGVAETVLTLQLSKAGDQDFSMSLDYSF